MCHVSIVPSFDSPQAPILIPSLQFLRGLPLQLFSTKVRVNIHHSMNVSTILAVLSLFHPPVCQTLLILNTRSFRILSSPDLPAKYLQKSIFICSRVFVALSFSCHISLPYVTMVLTIVFVVFSDFLIPEDDIIQITIAPRPP